MKTSHPWRVAIVVASSAFFANVACAQSIKPGLWEVSTKMSSSSGEMEKAIAQMQKQMASMSPEQRKIMEDMMGKQGMSMSSSGPGGTTIKLCVTPEMADTSTIPKQQGDCTHTNAPRNGNTMKFSFVCTKPPSSGEGQVTFVDANNYQSTMSVTATRNGKPETMNMKGTGKFLGSDCGTIKPIAAPRK